MPRDSSVYLEDMLEAVCKVRRYTLGLTRETFAEDEKTVDAVVRNLEVLGEAAKRIPEALRRESPDIPWQRIAGLRDILIHQYFGIDFDIVWDVIQTKVLPLERRLRELLDR